MTPIEACQAEVDQLELQLNQARARLTAARVAQMAATPLNERLVYAAHTRCRCGAGMAYDPTPRTEGIYAGATEWTCSDVLRFPTFDAARQAEVMAAVHDHPLPFATYEVKSELQTSAGGATTRRLDEAH